MTRKEDKERVKTSREELGKFFFRLAEITFTAMVVGATLSWFTNAMDNISFCIVTLGGIVFTVFFAKVGFKVINLK